MRPTTGTMPARPDFDIQGLVQALSGWNGDWHTLANQFGERRVRQGNNSGPQAPVPNAGPVLPPQAQGVPPTLPGVNPSFQNPAGMVGNAYGVRGLTPGASNFDLPTY